MSEYRAALADVALGEIGYRREGAVLPLPQWALFFVALGFGVARYRREGMRLVVAVSVPTRRYAAAFCALGIAKAAIAERESHEGGTHFERILALPKGTAVRYRYGDHLHTGRLSGAETRGDIDYIAINSDSGHGLDLLPESRWPSVHELEPGETFVRRRKLVANPGFVQACLGIDAYMHASSTSLDCLVVGVKDQLRQEICSAEFLVSSSSNEPVSGCLNDLLRCDAFELNPNDHDRTTIVSSFAEEVSEPSRAATPPAVILDGPSACLRGLRNAWSRSPAVAIIDRTSNRAPEAADAMNQDRALSLADVDLKELGVGTKLPAGLEAIAFAARFR